MSKIEQNPSNVFQVLTKFTETSNSFGNISIGLYEHCVFNLLYRSLDYSGYKFFAQTSICKAGFHKIL